MKNLLYAFTSTFLFFSSHFLVTGAKKNVFYMMQDRKDILSTYTLVLLSIAILFFLFELFKKHFSPYHLRIVSVFLLISLLPSIDLVLFNVGVQPGLQGIIRIIYPLLCLSYVPLIILISIRFRLEKWVLKLMPIFVAISILSLFYAIPRVIAYTVLKNEFQIKAGKSTIHVIIFDETSYEIIFDPAFEPYFPNFNQFAQQSYVFRNAYSPGCSTMVSIPKIICGQGYETYAEDNLRLLVSSTGETKLKELPVEDCLFDLAQKDDYNTIVIGGHIPYNDLFGEYFTYGHQYRSCPLFNYLLPWPYNKVLYFPRLKTNIFFAQFQDYMTQIETAPVNSLFFTHFLIPHWPYIFDENGVGKYYWATLLKGERYKAHERYIAQTRYVDKKLGEILELLKKTGKYDSSLIILTSDHDEKNSLDRTRIPLFVKAPYQQETIPVFERCNTINLNQFLNKYMTKDIIDVRQLYSVSE